MYYVLKEQPLGDATPLAAIGEYPETPGVLWLDGRRIGRALEGPLRFVLDPTAPGPLPLFLDGTIPLMHSELLRAFESAGVANLELYDAIIVDTETSDEYAEYKAVNVIGLIAAADLSQSTYQSHLSTPLISVDFDGLAIDEDKTRGMPLFRLAECVTAILVHERVKAAVEAADLYVGFIEPKDFVG